MTDLIWRFIAWVLCRPTVTAWIVKRAEANPYNTISAPDGSLYMWRGWLFNPYRTDAEDRPLAPRWPWLPSVRLHHIMRHDLDRHRHNHPWPNARTIVLDGWYCEEREKLPGVAASGSVVATQWGADGSYCDIIERARGDTARIRQSDYHRILKVSPGGVRTVFLTWGFLGHGVWGFDVQGQHVPRRQYEQQFKSK